MNGLPCNRTRDSKTNRIVCFGIIQNHYNLTNEKRFVTVQNGILTIRTEEQLDQAKQIYQDLTVLDYDFR